MRVCIYIYIFWTISLLWSGSKCLISLFVCWNQSRKFLQEVSEWAADEAMWRGGFSRRCCGLQGWGLARLWMGQKGWLCCGATCGAAAAGRTVLLTLVLVSFCCLLVLYQGVEALLLEQCALSRSHEYTEYKAFSPCSCITRWSFIL